MASTSATAGPSKNLFLPPSDSEDDLPPPLSSTTKKPQQQQQKQSTSPERRAGKGRETLSSPQGSAFASGSGRTGGLYVDSSDEDDDDGYDTEDPNDPVIKTLPVFLTPALANSLALLQYPHRPPAPHTSHPLVPPSLRPGPGEADTRPPSQRVSARYKSGVGQLELSVPLDVRQGVEEHRFNQDRAEDLGRGISKNDLGATGSGTAATSSTASGSYGNGATSYSDSRGFDSGNRGQLQRMTLLGETLPDQTWYTCAVLKDNEVHLTPLTRTMQMRASLGYLDEIDALDRSNAKKERSARAGDASDDERGSGGEGDSDYDDAGGAAGKSASAQAARKQKKAAAADKKAKQDDLKTINVSISGSEPAGGAGGGGGSNGQGGARDAKTARAAASLFGPIKAAQDETWVDLPFYDPLSEDANRVYEKLFASKTDKLRMVTSATQYLRL